MKVFHVGEGRFQGLESHLHYDYARHHKVNP